MIWKWYAIVPCWSLIESKRLPWYPKYEDMCYSFLIWSLSEEVYSPNISVIYDKCREHQAVARYIWYAPNDYSDIWVFDLASTIPPAPQSHRPATQIVKFMWPIRGPLGSWRPHVSPILAPRSSASGYAFGLLTHLGRVTHICVSKPDHHCLI